MYVVVSVGVPLLLSRDELRCTLSVLRPDERDDGRSAVSGDSQRHLGTAAESVPTVNTRSNKIYMYLQIYFKFGSPIIELYCLQYP